MSLSIFILTGQSGSGKSTALHALEDNGYLCIDNMPAALVEKLVSTIREDGTTRGLAVVIDVRDPGMLRDAPALVKRLREGLDPVRVIFFEAREEILLRRFSQTRRRHPLDHGERIQTSIDKEREILAPLRALADDTIDTSALSPHELRRAVVVKLTGRDPGSGLGLALCSFGFKHGLPLDADMVFDVRFLPNPYFDEDLRPKSGLDESVRSFVLGREEAVAWLDRAYAFLEFLLPHFKREGKRHVTVAVGCTGGRHRSVSIVHELARRFNADGVRAQIRHRDVGEGERWEDPS